MERFRRAMQRDGNHGEALNPALYASRFRSAMDSDLNTPQAIAVLFDLAREINRCHELGMDVSVAQRHLSELGGVLGLTFAERSSLDETLSVQPFIELLLETRAELRKNRMFDLADKIRDGLAGQGIALEDTPRGTEWQRQARS